MGEMHERVSIGAIKLTKREKKLIRGIYGKYNEYEVAIEQPLKRRNKANLSSVSSKQDILKLDHTDITLDEH